MVNPIFSLQTLTPRDVSGLKKQKKLRKKNANVFSVCKMVKRPNEPNSSKSESLGLYAKNQTVSLSPWPWASRCAPHNTSPRYTLYTRIIAPLGDPEISLHRCTIRD